MSKHTPEPWPPFIDVCEPATPHPDSNEIVCLGFDDYRRARTCVNACRGLSTDELEQHGLVSAVGTEIMELEKQRDELLETLEAAVKQMEDDLLFIDSECGSGRSLADLESEGELPPALLKSRELISNLKGGAA